MKYFLAFIFLCPVLATAKESTQLPITAFDGGIISAETLGRGGTVASNRGTAASGSENPAALREAPANSFYTTVLIDESSDLDKGVYRSSDALSGKVLNYMVVGSESGVIFFEPLGRMRDFSLDALGIAGAQKWRAGSFGFSLAYLRGSYVDPTDQHLDTANGVRMNLGIRHPTGPMMWGLVVQNAPGFLWWNHHKRDQLPLKVRVGNTWRFKPGWLLSADGEMRYYDEGSQKEDYASFGAEITLTDTITLRSGVFANDINDSDDRHLTVGLGFKADSGTIIAIAAERFRIGDEKVTRTLLSINSPFSTGLGFDENAIR